jgi:hypothetical protein
VDVNWQKASTLVGFAGGALGLAVAVASGAAVVLAYFATRAQLKTVDCYQYYNLEALSSQASQNALFPEYQELLQKAATAEIAHNEKPLDPVLLAQYKDAVQKQTDVYDSLTREQEKSKASLEESKKCGYRPGQL